MGGATTGTFWTGGEAAWGNPATLGSIRGLQFEWSTRDLTSWRARAQRFRAGVFGVGVEFGGAPRHIGFTWQEIHHSEFRYREEMDSWAVGANMVEVVDNVLLLAAPGARSLAPFFDFSLGYAEKDWWWVAGSPFPLEPSSTKLIDRGLRIRISPYNSIDGGGMFWRQKNEDRARSGGARFDLAYGFCRQNTGGDQARSGTGHSTRHGVAAHLAVGFSASARDRLGNSRFGWMVGRSTPLLALGAAWDHATWNRAEQLDQRFSVVETNHFGIELALADIIALRYGYVGDLDFSGYAYGVPELSGSFFGLPDGHALGIGTGVHVFDWIELRYDFASVEPARHHHAIVATVDGIAIARALQAEKAMTHELDLQ